MGGEVEREGGAPFGYRPEDKLLTKLCLASHQGCVTVTTAAQSLSRVKSPIKLGSLPCFESFLTLLTIIRSLSIMLALVL